MIFAPSLLRMGYITGWFGFSAGADPSIRTGEIIQVRTAALITTVSNATNPMPVDTSRPTNTEGTPLSSGVSITPLRANSRIQVSVSIPSIALDGGATQWVGAIFRDTGSIASSAAAVNIGSATEITPFFLTCNVPASSTAPTTFSFRFGPGTAGTARIGNTVAINPLFGPQPEYYMIAQEIAV
jgi:hypothetical protein